MTTKTMKALPVEQGATKQISLVFICVLLGSVLTSIWSYRFVDTVIGESILNTVLGHDAKAMPITSALTGVWFAFVSGVAGTFTACNICAFSALAPLAANEKTTIAKTVSPLLQLGAGLIAVAGIYGAVGAIWGPTLPQLSRETVGDSNFPVRLVQAGVVFVSIGLIMFLWGLTSLGLLRNPFASLLSRYPWVRMVFMGALIGGFLIGRPYAPFKKMFEHAASTHDPLYGALAFILQGLGNIALMAVVFLLIRYGTGGRFERWLYENPRRAQTFTAAAFIIGGTFFVTYWGVRIPSLFGIGWWPAISW